MKRGCLAALLGVTGCSGSLPDGDLGAAADSQVFAYSIAGVHASPESVHFTGLPWLLNSVEAKGPMVLTAHVANFVLPTMTTNVSGVRPAEVSQAVGYSFSERRDIYAVSSANLTALESQRLEAYTSFEETSWDVVDTSTGAVVGTGASFDPLGIFFQTVKAKHATLSDAGLFTFVQGCEDLMCLPLPGDGGEGDAGTPERRVPGFLPSPISPFVGIGGEGGAGTPPRR